MVRCSGDQLRFSAALTFSLLLLRTGLGLAQPTSIIAWGRNDLGQCNVPQPNAGFVAVVANQLQCLGLKEDGSIVGWGWWANQLNVPPPNTEFVAVASGLVHSLGLKANGSVIAWGDNAYGQCNIPAPNTGFVALAAGQSHSLGLKADGSIVAWGWNTYGQCNVPSPNTGFVAVAAGYYHSLGLKADGSIVAWGYNDFRIIVPTPNTGFVAVAGGGAHSLGLKKDGRIVAWGVNGSGQCNVPAANSNFVAIAGGYNHSLGLKNDGSIVGWGYNGYGQCDVPQPNTGFVALAAGLGHSVGLKGSQPIGHWGFDEFGSGSGDGIAYDSSQQAHHGAINGAVYEPGVVGLGALQFDGVGDFVGIAAAGSSIQLVNSDYTIAWWIKPNGATGTRRMINMDDGLNASGGYSCFLQNGSLVATHNNGTNNSRSYPVYQCGWQHLSVSYRKTTGMRVFYLNGVAVDSAVVIGGPLLSDGDDPLFFGVGGGGSQFFNGALDDIQVFDKTLALGEIRRLVLMGTPGPWLKIVSAKASNRSNSLEVTFNQSLSATSGEDASNYSVYPVGNPTASIPVATVALVDSVATLTLAAGLTLPTAYEVAVSGVSNQCGVPIQPGSKALVSILDVDPPTILFAWGFAGGDSLRVIFSEPVGAGASNPANYIVHAEGDPGNPLGTISATVSDSLVTLVLGAPLQGGIRYVLHISGVSDLHNNVVDPNTNVTIIPVVPLQGNYDSDLTLYAEPPGPNYQVIGDIHIAPGVTFTVRPGVTLSLAALSDGVNLGDYPDRVEILCEGSLIFTGTSEDNIIVQSQGQSPTAGDWGQIKIYGAGEGIFQNCAIRNARTGAFISTNKSATFSNCTIEGILEDGLKVAGGNVTVQTSMFRQINGRGIDVTAGHVNVSHSQFEQIGMEGYQQSGGSGVVDFNHMSSVGSSGKDAIRSSNSVTRIRWNTIQGSGGNGITVEGNASGRGPITGNSLSAVGNVGIYLKGSLADSIEFCDIVDCGSSGILLENTGVGELVENCLVVRAQDGILTVGGHDLTVRYTTIVAGRGHGIYHQDPGSPNALTLRNVIVASNQGWGIRDEAAQTNEDIRFIDVWNNAAGTYFGTVCDSVCLANNPLFASSPVDAYQLQPSSPVRIMGEGATQMGRYGPDPNNVVGISDGGEAAAPTIPLANFPNPFTSSTTISFVSEIAGTGRLQVYNVQGRLIRGESIQVREGRNEVYLESKGGLTAGIYFYRVSGPGFSRTSKMIVLW